MLSRITLQRLYLTLHITLIFQFLNILLKKDSIDCYLTAVMVTKRKDWYKNKLISIFGGVRIWEIENYYVFMAEKKKDSYSKTKKRNK